MTADTATRHARHLSDVEPTVGHWIAGRVVRREAADLLPVFDPATGATARQVEVAGPDVVDAALAAAEPAQLEWSRQPLARRVAVLRDFREEIVRESDNLAAIISSEHGKVTDDAMGEIQRGLEIVDLAIAASVMLKGEFSEQVSSGVDAYSMRQPVGVCLGITPFNFPAMVPLWMLPIALVCGNAFILKPSEQDPSASLLVARAATTAGLPSGLLNVVQGDRGTVERLIAHPSVRAVSFVGSTAAAQNVYELAASRGKRVQALGGAKNHVVVMPDADIGFAADQIVSAAYGSSGQRCMAVSVAVAVGEIADPLVDALAARAAAIVVGPATDNDAQMGPLVSRNALERVAGYVEAAEADGGTVVLDGRDHPAMSGGFFLGPTLVDRVRPGMAVYEGEVFGPVLAVARVETIDEALELIAENRYGNGASIFTASGAAARRFQHEVQAGMVGINVPVPAPVGHHSFGGWGESLFGDTHIYGPEGFRFYTRSKVVTARWPDSRGSSVSLAFPGS